jgi:pyruvate/2-oxoglutarate dehydrogenase complex dihydrolipoamide dehydrogenase (E3) component
MYSSPAAGKKTGNERGYGFTSIIQMKKLDAIVIGSGQGGTPLARKLAGAGYRTALIEKRYIGGTCINDGCTPTKTMIADAKTAYMVRNSTRWGVQAKEVTVDFAHVLARKNQVVQSFRSGSEKSLQQTANLELVHGEAVFTGEKELQVRLDDGRTEPYTAPLIFINTGTRPAVPAIEGLAGIPYYTSTTLLDAKELPQKLVILGGGYIGLELGQLFLRLGSQVNIIENGPLFLPHEDRDIAGSLLSALQQEGVRIWLNTKVNSVERDALGHITLRMETAGTPAQLSGTHLLLAAGRVPQTDNLQPQASGIATDAHGFIKVNEYLETNVPGIYALGDVKGGPAFTHISYNDYVILYKNLLEKQRISTGHRPVPYCMFTDPQLGRIGLTEQQAREKGLSVQTLRLPMNRVARAVETGNTSGLMKAVVDSSSGLILGAAVLGEEGGELMSLIQMAMLGNITAPQLGEYIFAHPLYAEALNNLFIQFTP